MQPWLPSLTGRARSGLGPSGRGSKHMATSAKVVNSAVGVQWPS